MKILFVCSGNICRSPIAEALLEKKIEESGPAGVEVASAGTLGIEEEPAHPLAVRVAAAAGCDLSAHRSRALTRRLVSEAGFVLVMESSHVDEALALDPSHRAVHLLTEFLSREEREEAGEDVPDPIGGVEEEFLACASLLQRCVDRFHDRLVRGDLRPHVATSGHGDLSEDGGAAAAGHEVSETRGPAGEEMWYFRVIEQRVLAARGGVSGLTSMEFHIVDRWWRAGVPLWQTIEVIEETSSRWAGGEAPRSFLKHCDRELERRQREAGDAETRAPERPSPREESAAGTNDAEAASRRAAAVLARALETSATLDENVRAALLAAIDELSSNAPATYSELEDLLRRVQADLAKAVGAGLPPGEGAMVRRQEELRLRALSPRMTNEAFEETLDRLTDMALLRRAGIGSLSLLDL